MREMVLNHASIFALDSDRESVTRWLKDLTRSMAGLVRERVVQSSLRMAQGFHDSPCLPGYSLFDACQRLRAHNHRDEYVLLMRLAAKIPLLSEVAEEVRDRFRACEHRILPAPDGEPLVFCAITDAIAVGFPSAPEWDRDRVTVHFDELLPDETLEPTSEEIDQLTRSAHAAPICDRHRARVRLGAGSDPVALWKNRGAVFPNLIFGPGVQDNLRKYAHLLSTIVGKLAALDASARDWRDRASPAPIWRTKVTSESQLLMANPALRESRRFRSHRGTREVFELHARFGDHGRIHFRFDAESREVEIGYIGPHLPV